LGGVGASREAPWRSSPERGERGKERGRWGCDGREEIGREGRHGGRVARGTGAAQPVAPLFGLHAAVCEKKGEGGRGKEKRRERKEKKKGRKKRKGKIKKGKFSKFGYF
jgi:hypothetical protein